MDKRQALATLAALAQANRLDVFLLIARGGPEGLSAGRVAAALGLAPSALTFHCNRLRHANLVRARRAGRSVIYATHPGSVESLVNYLTEYCCRANRRPRRAARAKKAAGQSSSAEVGG